MCGIAGIIDPTLSAQEINPLLKGMTNAIIHRGPDDEGFFVTGGVGLGMRRLSIIDVAGGHQPIGNENGAVQVVFNGEIYNYLELRNALESRGHQFYTHSDTEVIAHLYEEKGAECVNDLRGMFGLAIWDQPARRLVLARDRLGKKPLFYAQRGDRLIFGSEIKTILAADPSLAEADPEAIVPYFQYGFVPEPGTMFRHIKKLCAAHYLVFEQGRVHTAPYWCLNFAENEQTPIKTSQWIEELDALLEESVRIRLMSEVPLGVFLSGGLDSSTIVAYAHKAGVHPLKTFTIGFDRPEWDESADAQKIADHFQTDHHVLMLREQDLARNLPETVLDLVRHFDEPFGDQSSLPTYYVSKLAREHVTVILSGDGGDELFAGYNTYKGIKFAEQYRRLPSWLGKQVLPSLANGVANCLPNGQRYRALRVAKVLQDSSLSFEDAYFNKNAVYRQESLQQLLTQDVMTQPRQNSHSALSTAMSAVMQSNLPVVSKMSYIDMRLYLLDDLLVKMDRMSMAHSLEVRSPLLDHKLVEFAARMPPALKLRGWETKAILRDTVRRYLPPDIVRKPKQGFKVPLREWLRTGLSTMVGDYLEAANGRLPQEIFNHTTIQTILRQHRIGEADHSSKIWLLLNYAAWHDLYLRQGVY